MKYCFRVAAVLLLVTATSKGQQSAQTLADVLTQKGILSPEERIRIRAAGANEAVQLLTAMLQKKGVLNDQEALLVSPSIASPAQESASLVSGPATPPRTPAALKTEASPVTSASRLPVVIYGTALLNAFYNTSLNNNQDVPLFAGKQGSDPTGGDKNFGMTVRQSRIGLRYTGPQVGGASLGGTVELDMFSGNATLPNSVGFDVPRLRLAYGRADWKDLSIIAGQDWSVFAPLNPTSFAGYAIPDLAGSGNLWIRTPQIRAEFRQSLTDKRNVQIQIAATDPNVGDYQSTFSTVRLAGIGERGRSPGFDSRLSYSDGRLALGLSGHYSRGKNAGLVAGTAIQTGVDSWGVAADYTVPVGRKSIVSGEAYAGRALGIFSSGLGESVGSVGTPGQHGVLSRGGWLQAQMNWTKMWQSNLVYGLESLDARQIIIGNRNKTQTYMGNLIYKVSPTVTIAWEWKRFLTNFRNQRTVDEQGDHVNMAIAFSF